MACRKAFDLDLVACLLDVGRPEWTEFREHYPRCPECAAEVRTWTELQGSLAPPHPGPEDLARFESRANDLSPEARKAIATHIGICRSCRDELRALRAFDPQVVAADRTKPRSAKRRWWRPVGRVVLHPAFAYGMSLVLVLALPVAAPDLARLVVQQVETAREHVFPRADVERAGEQVRRERARDVAPTTIAGAPPLGASRDGVLRDAPAARPAERLALAKSEPPLLEARRRAASSDEWPVVVLTPDREVVLHVPSRGLVLRLAPPRSQPALPAGLAWLRVRDAAGRRELREQQFGTPGSNAEIRVPAAWLEPGAYRADIVLGDDNRPVTVARFRVEP